MAVTPGTWVEIHTTSSRDEDESLKFQGIIYNLTNTRFEEWTGAAWVLHTGGVLDSGGDLVITGGMKNILNFAQDNAAASQAAVLLPIQGDVILEARLPFAGSIIGMSVFSNAARTAGTLTVEAFVDGAGTGFTAVLDATNTTINSVTQAKDLDTFIVGDSIQIKITTDAGWLPVTADIRVALVVEI